jgi:hypothetical protein
VVLPDTVQQCQPQLGQFMFHMVLESLRAIWQSS